MVYFSLGCSHSFFPWLKFETLIWRMDYSKIIIHESWNGWKFRALLIIVYKSLENDCICSSLKVHVMCPKLNGTKHKIFNYSWKTRLAVHLLLYWFYMQANSIRKWVFFEFLYEILTDIVAAPVDRPLYKFYSTWISSQFQVSKS